MSPEKQVRIAQLYLPIGALATALGALTVGAGMAIQAEGRWSLLEAGQAEGNRARARIETKLDRVLADNLALDRRVTILEAHVEPKATLTK